MLTPRRNPPGLKRDRYGWTFDPLHPLCLEEAEQDEQIRNANKRILALLESFSGNRVNSGAKIAKKKRNKENWHQTI